ncbi:MAG: hypothetical protein HY083_09760 [Gammaproteobacteria bacterium]|nr:hypothetical protein [Gammaproteobacteria bacterium]
MKPKIYLMVSGTLFALVALLHLLRIVFNWQAVIGSWTVPMWLSWIGLAVTVTFCTWAYNLARRV